MGVAVKTELDSISRAVPMAALREVRGMQRTNRGAGGVILWLHPLANYGVSVQWLALGSSVLAVGRELRRDGSLRGLPLGFHRGGLGRGLVAGCDGRFEAAFQPELVDHFLQLGR